MCTSECYRFETHQVQRCSELSFPRIFIKEKSCKNAMNTGNNKTTQLVGNVDATSTNVNVMWRPKMNNMTLVYLKIDFVSFVRIKFVDCSGNCLPVYCNILKSFQLSVS